MGHGDEIVLADIHFPTASSCRNGPIEIRADGHPVSDLLAAILKVFPLDEYVDSPVTFMRTEPQDRAVGLIKPPVWSVYERCLENSDEKNIVISEIGRFEFYDRAKNAFAVVHTGETAKYGNVILKKGIVNYN